MHLHIKYYLLCKHPNIKYLSFDKYLDVILMLYLHSDVNVNIPDMPVSFKHVKFLQQILQQDTHPYGRMGIFSL